MKRVLSTVVAAHLIAGTCAPAFAAQPAPQDLSRITIEDLLNIEITSASRKDQRLADTAAAVFVLTRDDIRRSGMRTVPDLLRLVPGVDVAQINANKWAVSVRGFNGLFANKLLVLVDGRTVYNLLFSGVLWDGENVPLEDIERIEVIRGPGGALWGANAVNGVINIITRPASADHGLSVDATAGTFDRASGRVRYSDGRGRFAYRIESAAGASASSVRPDTITATDDSRRMDAGGRIDWTGDRSTVAADVRATGEHATALWLTPTQSPTPLPSTLLGDESSMSGVAVTLHATRRTGQGRQIDLQSSFDAQHRDEPVGDYRHRAGAVDLQYRFGVAARHDVVAGGGYRTINEQLSGRAGYALNTGSAVESIASLFVQDEVALPRRVKVSIGAKTEHDSHTGWTVEPTIRASWQPRPSVGHLWTAVSRAVRTPSLQDRAIDMSFPVGAEFGIPVVARLTGNPTLTSESVVSAEGGFRFEHSAFTADLAVFRARYRDLRTMEPGVAALQILPTGPTIVMPLRFDSRFAANTSGVELSGRWQPFASWRVEGGCSTFALNPAGDRPVTGDPSMSTYDGDAPRRQWRAASLVTWGRDTDLDVHVFRTGALKRLGVEPYTRLDLRVERRLGGGVSLRAVGANLLHASHAEYSTLGNEVWATRMPRSVRAEIHWNLR